MTDYTAQIKSKGLDATGVTEDVVRGLYSKLGSHVMLICEARVDARSDGTDGTHKVQLSLTQVEPAVDGNLNDHLRELTRTLYYNRQVDKDQPTLDGDSPEPNFDEVLAAGAQHRPHPYLASQLSIDDNAVCDICGLLEDAGVHRADTTTGPAAEDQDDDGADGTLDEADEPHEFTDAGDGSCRLCERDEDAAVHAIDDAEQHDHPDDESAGQAAEQPHPDEDEPSNVTALTFSGR